MLSQRVKEEAQEPTTLLTHILDVFGLGVTQTGRLDNTADCCGCLGLMHATQLICIFNLVLNTVVLSNTSSIKGTTFAGVHVDATQQIGNATWALIGVPLIVCGGFGAVYRIYFLIRAFVWYQHLSLIQMLFWSLRWAATGQACSMVPAGKYYHHICITGSACLFFMWLGGIWVWLYFTYITWSAAEECRLSEYPEAEFYITMMRAQEAAAEAAPLTGRDPKPWVKSISAAPKQVLGPYQIHGWHAGWEVDVEKFPTPRNAGSDRAGENIQQV